MFLQLSVSLLNCKQLVAFALKQKLCDRARHKLPLVTQHLQICRAGPASKELVRQSGSCYPDGDVNRREGRVRSQEENFDPEYIQVLGQSSKS